MSDDTARSITTEPQQTVSEPIVIPTTTQDSTEPMPSGTEDSAPTTILPVAPEAPTPLDTPISAETSVSAPEPEKQPLSPAPPVPVAIAAGPNPRSFLSKALAAIQFRKKAKLEKIMKLVNQKKSITNDQVQKLLYVSDTTASRYLLQLVKDGKLKKVGPDGRARYEPASGSLPTN